MVDRIATNARHGLCGTVMKLFKFSMQNTHHLSGKPQALWQRLQSLRVVIALTVVAGVVLASFFSYVQQTSDLRERHIAQIHGEMDHLGALIALALREPLWQFEAEQANSIMEAAFINPDVVSIAIWDDKGTPFATRVRNPENPALVERATRMVERNKTMVGKLELQMSTSGYVRKVSEVRLQYVRQGLQISIGALVVILLFMHWRLVRPMAKVTSSMVSFRRDPADMQAVVVPGTRRDEIGVAEHELAAMQNDLRVALRQNQRLAELGAAVSKISHDLRNILATATLLTDRLNESADPEVRRVAPSLMRSIDRAVTLCNDTLRFGRADEAAPHRSDFDLHELVEDVGASAGVPAGRGINWSNEVPAPFPIRADKEQVFRALLNLTRNAVQALEGRGGRVVARAAKVNGHIEIDVIDTGPGLPAKARDALFKPFAGSARSGGTGLGLAIARDIARAHRGDIHLVRSDDRGTQFRLEIADA